MNMMSKVVPKMAKLIKRFFSLRLPCFAIFENKKFTSYDLFQIKTPLHEDVTFP